MIRRYPERNSRGADLSLGADEALCHGRLADEERVCDLRGGEPSDLSQRERHLRIGGKSRVAAGEDEREPVVGDRAHAVILLRKVAQACQELGLAGEGLLATDTVDGAIARGRDDPGAGVAGHAFVRPTVDRDRERVLDGVLGKLEVAEDTNEDRDCTAPFLTEDLVDSRVRRGPPAGQRSTTGRISIEPYSAAGTIDASRIASSRSGSRVRKRPPIS